MVGTIQNRDKFFTRYPLDDVHRRAGTVSITGMGEGLGTLVHGAVGVGKIPLGVFVEGRR